MKSYPVLIATLLVLIITPVYAQKVNTIELKGAKPVEFTNYSGPPKRSASATVVRKIGSKLAQKAKKTRLNHRARYRLKYSIIRTRARKSEKEKYSADIFIIERNAMVRNIVFVQYMLSGYLRKAYGYKPLDADTLAIFIVYYNAVYRGDMTYFSDKYNATAMKFVSKKNVGIDTHYRNWAGKTRMLIPLTGDPKKGSLASIDPSSLVTKKVREAVRDDKRNIPARKKIVKLQEKEIKKDKKEVEEKKKEVKEKKKDIAQKKETIKEKKKNIAKKEKEISKEKEKAKKIKNPVKRKAKQKEIAKKEKRLKQEQREIKKEEKTIAKQDKAVKKEEKTIAKTEKAIEKKQDSVKEQKREIAKDEVKGTEAEKLIKEKEAELAKKEKDLKKKEDEIKKTDADKAIIGDKLYYLKINEWVKNGHYNNELFMINAATMKVMKKSPVENIGGRKYIAFSKGIVVITHPGGYSGENFLTLVDNDKLTAIATSKENVFWRSFVELNNGAIFAVIIRDGKYYLGKFDDNMKLIAASKDEVLPDTFISFFKEKIYINSKNKRVMVLKSDDLTVLGTIQP